MLIWKWIPAEKMWRMSLLSSKPAFDLDEDTRVVQLPGGGCALLSKAGVRLNGMPCLPFQVLGDRDEIFTRNHVYSFTAESPAEVVPFKVNERRMRCTRCLGWLKYGDPVLKCPRCGAHHHAEHWTYAPGCPKCVYPTAGLLSIPDPLE